MCGVTSIGPPPQSLVKLLKFHWYRMKIVSRLEIPHIVKNRYGAIKNFQYLFRRISSYSFRLCAHIIRDLSLLYAKHILPKFFS